MKANKKYVPSIGFHIHVWGTQPCIQVSGLFQRAHGELYWRCATVVVKKANDSTHTYTHTHTNTPAMCVGELLNSLVFTRNEY